MAKTKKKFFISLFVAGIFVIGGVFSLWYLHKLDFFSHVFNKSLPKKTVSIFGKPQGEKKYTFPANTQAFSSTIGSMKSSTVKQQTINIYRTSNQKQSIFTRGFYADGFHGRELSYTISSNSAEFTQTGSLGTIGCSSPNCILPWNNYYSWDAQQQSFILDNAAHKEEFTQLLKRYDSADANGCQNVGLEIVKGQDAMSFTELYKRYHRLSWYCSKTQGILPANLIYFLQIKKALQEIIQGKEIGSNDIRNVSL